VADERDGSSAFWDVWDIFERGGVLVACAWCDRICVEGVWGYAPIGALDAIDGRQTLSHSICPQCAAKHPGSVGREKTADD
jgi:hypothetical protein